MAAIRIAIIDDHPLFREGVARSLQEIGGFEIVGEGGTRDDAVRLAAEQRPDIVLMDISMPGGGLAAIAPILQQVPGQKIVILTVSETAEDVARALEGGARGYVLKGVGSRALADILREIAGGESYVSPNLSARLLSGLAALSSRPLGMDRLGELTGREHDVLDLVASGMSNKQIALQLDLQEKTVKHHMTRILAKLEASNRTEAAIKYREASREF